MRQATRDLGQIQSVWIWDERGRAIGSNRFATPPAQISVLDREYFQWAMRHRDPSWFVTQPLKSRATGEPFFDFAKRREDAQGNFAGVLSVSLYPSYFARFFDEQVKREPGLAMGLARSDGSLIARTPAVAGHDRLEPTSQLLHAMQAGKVVGEVQGKSPVDGQARMVAYRKVGSLPLYVYAALAEDSVLASWASSMAVLAAFTFPLALVSAGLTSLAMRRAAGEARALRSLHEQLEHGRRAEDALRRAQKLEALGRITGGVAHDFNNLMMVVQTSSALGRRLAASGRPLDKVFDSVDRAVSTGSKLTRQLLTFARRQPLNPTVVSLGKTLPAVADLIRTTVGPSIQVRHDLDPSLPSVCVDISEFQLALLNLALNARDAMPDGGELRIRAAAADAALVHALLPQADPSTSFIAVEMADSGTGIDKDIQDMVFEPFFTTKAHGRGTGLGLAQVYGFASQAGGAVSLQSEPGAGTVVTIVLPATSAEAAPSVDEDGALPTLHGSILVVEDNNDIADVISPLLEQMGARVHVCHRADDALKVLRSTPDAYDAVLSDIAMPGAIDGLELALVLAKERPELPVVLMTGYSAQFANALDLGIEVLSKPCPPRMLGDAMARALHRAVRAPQSTERAR